MALVELTPEFQALAAKILSHAGRSYTPYQAAEIPKILNAQAKYNFCLDIGDLDELDDCFLDVNFKMIALGNVISTSWQQQYDNLVDMAPTSGPDRYLTIHIGGNHIIKFTDDTHARLLYRHYDHCTYYDNEDETVSGWGIYIDEFVKCDDGVWRMTAMRLNYTKRTGVNRFIAKSGMK